MLTQTSRYRLIKSPRLSVSQRYNPGFNVTFKNPCQLQLGYIYFYFLA